MTETEKKWLKNLGIDPDQRLDPNDPRCEETSLHLVFLLTYIQTLESKQNMTPEKRAQEAQGSPEVKQELEGPAKFAQQLKDHENRLNILEQKGWHLQIGVVPFYEARFASGAPNTYGVLGRLNIIDMLNKQNGIAITLEGGYAKQTHSELAAWGFGLSWYHVLNSDRPKGSTTVYATRLGGCVRGGWKIQNIQDEMELGACAGFQIVPGSFALDFGVMLGEGRYGLYQDSTRMGYSAIRPVLGLELGVLYNAL
jgi:hypothetical protein